MKKIYTALLSICLAAFLLSGCNREKPTAADSVKAIYDLYILGDTSGVERLGMPEEDISNAINAYDNALAETIRSNFSASGLEMEDETLEAICRARKEALSKMNAECTVISEEGDTAVVELSTTWFDEETLDTDAAYDAREKADAAGYTDYDEYLNFIMETYTDNLLEEYKNVTPSEDRKEITVNCIIVNNSWLPEDMAAFGSELSLAITGQ